MLNPTVIRFCLHERPTCTHVAYPANEVTMTSLECAGSQIRNCRMSWLMHRYPPQSAVQSTGYPNMRSYLFLEKFV